MDCLWRSYIPVDLLTNLAMNNDLSMPFYRLSDSTSRCISNPFDNTQHTRSPTQI